MQIHQVILNVDGASRGNPGPGSIGVVIKDTTNGTVAVIAEKIGYTTNNQAEYKALIAGLNKAISLGAKEITVKSDSELIVKQVLGRYRVKKEELKPLYAEVKRLTSNLDSFKINHVPRSQNREADRLANIALDQA